MYFYFFSCLRQDKEENFADSTTQAQSGISQGAIKAEQKGADDHCSPDHHGTDWQVLPTFAVMFNITCTIDNQKTKTCENVHCWYLNA